MVHLMSTISSCILYIYIFSNIFQRDILEAQYGSFNEYCRSILHICIFFCTVGPFSISVYFPAYFREAF